MAENNNKLEQNQKEQPMTFLGRSLLTGFIGGIFWSLIGLFMYYFNFAEISPKFLLVTSWTKASWTNGWLGNLVTVILAGILSIVIAYVYLLLFKKINTMWMGVIYGVLLWVIIFYVAQPMFANIPTITSLHSHTIISTLSLFLLYGTFIGYSISYDYHDSQLGEVK